MAKQERIMVARKIDITRFNEEEQERYKTRIDAALLKVKQAMEDIRDKRLRREERVKEKELIANLKQQDEEGRANRYKQRDKVKHTGKSLQQIEKEEQTEQTIAKEEKKEQKNAEELKKWAKEHKDNQSDDVQNIIE